MQFKLAKSQILLIALVLIAAVIALTAFNFIRPWGNNLHLVPGNKSDLKIFRSGQLSTDDLTKLINKEDIDIVLNLRGTSHHNAKWYTDEVETCQGLDTEHHSISFNQYSAPWKKKFLEIMEVLDYAKQSNKNLLIHCYAGSDRTGFITAIAQIYLYGFSVDEAMKSYSLKYGHVPDPNNPLEKILESYKTVENEIDFHNWIKEKYRRDDFNTD